mmetsp:Transcript_62593/g.167161  ORF Transcript_62593/g.167161 Transcript_62593/m.167161 type:complete len:202 (-) Transcript_62593:16-621(-)
MPHALARRGWTCEGIRELESMPPPSDCPARHSTKGPTFRWGSDPGSPPLVRIPCLPPPSAGESRRASGANASPPTSSGVSPAMDASRSDLREISRMLRIRSSLMTVRKFRSSSKRHLEVPSCIGSTFSSTLLLLGPGSRSFSSTRAHSASAPRAASPRVPAAPSGAASGSTCSCSIVAILAMTSLLRTLICSRTSFLISVT